MIYGIVTYGSRGDVQPFIALALALIKKGATVRLLANENFATMAADYGIGFYPLPGNTEKMLSSSELNSMLKSGNLIAYLKALRKLTRREQGPVLKKMLEYCKAFDVLIATPLTMVWVFLVAESLKKPWALVQLSIPALPTGDFPFPALDFFHAKGYNRFSYRFMRWLFWSQHKKDIQTQRLQLKLPPLNKSLLKVIDELQIPQLYAFSRYLIQRPADWPPQADITGFLTLPPITPKKFSEEALAEKAVTSQWLKQGKPPVYIGWGSIPVPDPEIFMEVVHYLLANTRERYIYCQGWTPNLALPGDNRLLVIKDADHDWLLPQCKQAVIHGGIGTIGAVLRAKIPMVILSIFGDQPLWGRLIERKHMGVHIPFRKLTGLKLFNALQKADRQNIKATVHAVGNKMKTEEGALQAVSKLETYFNNLQSEAHIPPY